MTMVKLKMKAVYKTFLSFIGLLLVIAFSVGLLYIFSDKKFLDDSDVEVNGSLSINYIDSKNFSIENTDAIKFSITNSSASQIFYNVNFMQVRGTGSYVLRHNEEVVLEGTLSTADEAATSYISLEAAETKDFVLEIVNTGETILKGQINIRTQSSKLPTFADVILSNVAPTESTLTKVGDEVATEDEGLIKSSDDAGTSYYFRGNVQNNYVSFGDLTWRIVRVNGDGTVRLVLDNVIDTVASYYTADNLSFDFENSNINEFLENWLLDNLKDQTKYIANSKFCNDISHDETFNYNANTRIITNKIPTLNCLGNEINNSIGLLTIDEIVLAGASPNAYNRNYYLYNDSITDSWYTMTGASGSNSYINMFMIDASGSIKTDVTGNLYRKVRPVINLVKNIEMEGSGSKEDPYRIINL